MFEEDVFDSLPWVVKCIALGMIEKGMLPAPRYWYVQYIEDKGINKG